MGPSHSPSRAEIPCNPEVLGLMTLQDFSHSSPFPDAQITTPQTPPQPSLLHGSPIRAALHIAALRAWAEFSPAVIPLPWSCVSLCLHKARGRCCVPTPGSGFFHPGTHGGCCCPSVWWLWVPALLGMDVNAVLTKMTLEMGQQEVLASHMGPQGCMDGDGAPSLTAPALRG